MSRTLRSPTMSTERKPKPPRPAGKQPTFATAGAENEPWIVTRPVNRTWIEFNAQDAGNVRSRVRKHAATASAAARKATIARKEAAKKAIIRGQDAKQRQPVVNASQVVEPPSHAGEEENVLRVLQSIGGDSAASHSAKDGEGLLQFLEFVGILQEGRDWYSGGLQGTSLARKAISTMLWDSFANIDTLFQAALFMSGTHSNSCGLPSHITAHQGPALLVLRGASLRAVEAAVKASEAESSTSIAIALLAGWERRYGDAASYKVHMNAWREMRLPAKALEENNVSTLTDVTLEIFRQKLDERSFISPSEIKVRQQDVPSPPSSSINGVASLPPGFKVFHTGRPEVRSVLMLMASMSQYPLDDPASIAGRRKAGIEIIAWNPTHTRGPEANPLIEAQYDQLELQALYHLRSALISINGLLLELCMKLLGVTCLFNVQVGLDVHCASCQHLNTESLLGTKYEEVAFWSRFILCAISRDPERDDFLRDLLKRLQLNTWWQVRDVLIRHMDIEPGFSWKCWNLYRILTSEKAAGQVFEVPE